MEDLENFIVKSLSPVVNTMPLNIKLNDKAFKKYHLTCTQGIFLTALTERLPNGKENNCDNWLTRVTSSLVELIEWGTDCVINLQQVFISKVSVSFVIFIFTKISNLIYNF